MNTRMTATQSRAVVGLMSAGLLLLTWLSLSSSVAHAAPGILYAAPSPGGSGDCSNWADACTLQTALTSAGSGDQIWVQMGVHKPTTTTNRTISFMLKSGVAVYGGFNGSETALDQRNPGMNITVLSGDIDNNDLTDPNGVVTTTNNIIGANGYHVVNSSGVTETAVLDGFTITAGQANGAAPNNSGGGMLNDSSSPTLSDVTFSGNFALQGGGMHNTVSSPRLTNITFSGNSANASGGGLLNESNSNPILTNVTFVGNSAGSSGGGIFNWLSSNPSLTFVTFISNTADTGGGMFNFGSNSNPTLTNVEFTGNTATRWGGGMFLNRITIPVLTNVIFNGNNAQSGGGMFSNDRSSPILTNVLFSGNSATGSGGGMFNAFNNSPALTNVTFSGNFAALDGGGMYNAGGSTPILANTVLWGNTASNSGPQIYNASGSPTISYSDIQGSGGSGAGWDTGLGTDAGGNIDADPLFVDASGGDLHLQSSSPAIDAGNNVIVTVSTDLDGNPRFVDIPGAPDTGNGAPPIVDMGPYEAQSQTRFIYLPSIMKN